MKQIIHIQLGGRSIAIEDTAAANVQQYLDSLRAHFAQEPGKEEILSDIESRFSELMSDKLRKGAPHITEEDVDEMIATMGRPEDLADGAAAAGNQQQEDAYANTSYGSRKLYRDENNKKLGGGLQRDCALAEYRPFYSTGVVCHYCPGRLWHGFVYLYFIVDLPSCPEYGRL